MSPDITVEISPSHNLIGTRMMRQADGSLRFIPTRHDFWQRVSLSVLLGVLGATLLGFMLFLELRAPRPLSAEARETLPALRGLQILGGMIILGGILPLFSWFRKRLTMYLDERQNLVFASRVWISRRETFPLSSLKSITYGVRRENIGPVHIHELRSTQKLATTTVWVWTVTLLLQPRPSDGKPRQERFDVASQEAQPRSGDRLPEEVIALCTWLRDTTGKPITASVD